MSSPRGLDYDFGLNSFLYCFSPPMSAPVVPRKRPRAQRRGSQPRSKRQCPASGVPVQPKSGLQAASLPLLPHMSTSNLQAPSPQPAPVPASAPPLPLPRAAPRKPWKRCSRAVDTASHPVLQRPSHTPRRLLDLLTS
jgi:hypothetical protein